MPPISDIYVASEGDPNCKLWIVGEAPGWNEEKDGRPFIGESGKKLEETLARYGVSRSEVFITNLCHYRPAANKFEILFRSRQLEEGVTELHNLLQIYKPNVVAALGNYPLLYLTAKNGISKYRGSILSYASSTLGKLDREQKVIGTYHPAYILRNRSVHPIFDVDIGRIVEDANFPELNLPEYDITIDPPELDYWMNKIKELKFVTCDIENVKKRPDRILCVGFGTSPTTAVVLSNPNDSLSKRDFVAEILSSNEIEKCFHYGSHDVTCFRLNDYIVENYAHDTINQAHVLCPELPRSLEYLASVETRQPYYKGEGRGNIPDDNKGWTEKQSKEELYIYNGKDCCVTYMVYDSQVPQLKESELYDYYLYRMELQQACLEIGDSGLLVDPIRRSLISEHIKKERAIFTLLFYRLTDSRVNVGSNKQMTNLLYKKMKLPEKKKTKIDKKTGEKTQVLTADETALVSLITFCNGKIQEVKKDATKLEWTLKLEALNMVLKIREYDKLISSYTDVPLFADGRARSIYKACGTETSRLSNVKYVDDSGFNVQTAPRFILKIEDKKSA